VIRADDGEASTAEKARERVAESFDGAVVVEMVRIDVRHERELGAEVKERPVALVGLDDEPLPAPPGCTGPDLVDVTADQKRRVEIRFEQDQGQHRGRRGLAMRPEIAAHRRSAVIEASTSARDSTGIPAPSRLHNFHVADCDRGRLR
jgi:hypothetical protein